MARKTPRLYLEHIQEAIASIERYVADKTFDDFAADDMLRAAVERRIEIISEASPRLPPAMKALSRPAVARYRLHRQRTSP